MIYNERKADLFTIDHTYHLAHCISSDFALGAGIALTFQQRMGKLLEDHKIHGECPDAILTGRVFNLVTKENAWGKPTMQSLEGALNMMKDLALEKGIHRIAMPRIGCGLDRLKWEDVSATIRSVFADTDIEILVCYLKE